MTARNIIAMATIVVVFPLLWILHGKKIIVLPDSVIGMTITLETLMIQFFFRKKEAS